MTEFIKIENESAFYLKGKEYPMFYTLYVFTGKKLFFPQKVFTIFFLNVFFIHIYIYLIVLHTVKFSTVRVGSEMS